MKRTLVVWMALISVWKKPVSESLKAAVPLPFAIMGYSETFCYKAISKDIA